MNRSYRLLWSAVRDAWIPAAENARGQGKRASRPRAAFTRVTAALAAATLALGIACAQAGASPASSSTGPSGGAITAGSGSISQSGTLTTITQASPHLSLTWASFNIPAQDIVDFVQPSASAIAVNRILDVNGTQILGHLNANGQVYLINPNGIVFGPGAEVNVGGLVASTLALDDASLPADAQSFGSDGTAGSPAGAGSIINQGTIHAAPAGYVVLLGTNARNSGVISAQLGTVALGAGSAATLRFLGTHLVSMQIDQGVLASVVDNGGLIRADGGQVLMTAGAQKALMSSVVNNTGVIEARTLDHQQGSIILRGGMVDGTVDVAGTLDASAPDGGNGGAIETSAAQVEIANDAMVTTAAAHGLTGSWLIDPTDFTIAASGGDETGAALSTALLSNNVQIQSSGGATGTSGNVNVDDVVTWNANTLTLTAQNNININSAMNGSGTASLALQYGQGALNAGNPSTYTVNAPVNLPAGPNFSTQLGSDGAVVQFTVITALGAAADATTAPGVATLQGIAATANLAGNFALGANIDASATAGWNNCASCNAGGAGHYGFTPIGTAGNTFIGNFDGLGHTISGLTINQPTTPDVGLFGYASSGVLQNVGLIGGSVTGGQYVGSLAAISHDSITNSYVTGSTTANVATNVSNAVGGLVAFNYGTIERSYTTGAVTGAALVGGLVGENLGGINDSYATGVVYAAAIGSIPVAYAGGLVGDNIGTISNSHASGASVTGGSYVGGLAGESQGAVSSSYATDPVTGTQYVGGLLGVLQSHAEISNCYATGAVTGISDIGGLVGYDNQGLLSNAFFNVDQVSVNGSHQLTQGGLYNAQYLDWFTHGETLDIANYSSSLPPGSGGYYNVSSVQGLQDLLGFSESNTADNFRLTADIALPPGFSIPYFAGSFDGNGKTLSNLSLNIPNSNLGLFGYLPSTGTAITDVAVSNASVIGESRLGGLVGSDVGATITDSYVSGNVAGNGSIGAANNVGGLVGAMGGGSISNSYSAGTVSSTGSGYWVGGLVGVVYAGTVSNSYSTANVTGTQLVGGLVGTNYGTISKSYAAGQVSGTIIIGGGFAGNNDGTITNSFYNSSVNPGMTGLSSFSGPRPDSAGVAWGLNGAQIQAQANFNSATADNGGINPGWDLANTWIIYEGHTAPLLRSFMTPLTVTAKNATQVYDGVAYSGGNGLTYSATDVGDGNVFYPADMYSGTSQGAVHVGTYAIELRGAWSDQQGYILTLVNGSLSITPAPLTVSGTIVGTRAYNGMLNAPLSGGSLVGVVPGDSVTLVQAGNFASAGVGSGIPVTAMDSLTGPSALDYSLIQPLGLRGTISPATTGTTPGAGSDSALLAADYASGQLDANFIAPQWGAVPQFIDASPSIDVLETAMEPATTDPGVDENSSSSASQGVVINVAMQIGATGTLKIVNGGLRLPITHLEGNP
jgi:filamentous hemagglutinin family protein